MFVSYSFGVVQIVPPTTISFRCP